MQINGDTGSFGKVGIRFWLYQSLEFYEKIRIV